MEKTNKSEQEGDLSLVGFEKVFVQLEQRTNNEQSSEKVDVHEHIHDVDTDSTELVSMAEAARRLKMPYPTLRRQVLAGKLPSIQGPDGKPLVKLMATEHSANRHEQTANKAEHSSANSENSTTIQRLLELIEAERAYARSLNEKLEAANHRNGYLEAQTEGYQDQIKLLTDSQHKRGWWARFASWFVTGR